jgi:small conductance mechanosensitive channel
MLERTKICILAICLGGSLIGWAPIAYSQEDSAPAAAEQDADLSKEEKLAASAQALMESIHQQRDELSELNKSYRGSKGEEKAILWSQIRAKREALGKSIKDLLDQVGDLEEASLDASQPKQLARDVLTSIAGELQRSITASEKRVTELREQRGSVSPEELEGLDKELAERSEATDEDLAALLDVTGLMESQGIDNRAQLGFLDTTLQERAERLSGVLQFLAKERASIAKPSAGASDEEKQAVATKLAALNERIAAAADHLGATVEVMKARELETAAYKQLLFESTGEITQDIFETEVAFGLLQGWVESGRDWVIQNGPRWLFKIIVFVLILLAFKFLAGIVKRLMRKTLSSSKIDLTQLLENQIVSFTGKAMMFLGLLVALSQLGIQLGPLLAGLGIAGFIIGFALQDTLSNFAAGMMILIYRPYDVGDAVEAGGVMGSVKAMNLVSTTIATWDNQKMVVPNSKIWGDVIRNITAEPHRRVDMTFGIAYGDDIDHAERVLWDIVKSHELVLEEPATVIRLHTLGESSVDFVVRPWAKTSDYWTVYWDVTRAVKKRFDAEGISIPFPQRDVHLFQEPAAT